MNPFIVQKYLFRLFYLVAFMLFVGIFVYAFKTEMEMESVGEQAPFTNTLQAANDTLPKNRSITLDEPHRTPRELGIWVSQSVSEVLTFDSAHFDEQLKKAEPYFSPAGYNEFKNYLQQAELKNTLMNGNLKANVIVEQLPLLLNSGAVGGVFRWLYEVPVTISYTLRQQREIQPDKPGDMNRHINVRLQLGRYDDSSLGEGVRIETWAVTGRR